MRVWRGWIAAVLLTALAFAGGPDALDAAPPAAQSKIVEKRTPQTQAARTRRTPDAQTLIAERHIRSHLRLSALLPVPQTPTPVPARGVGHDASYARPDVTAGGGRRPHVAACTPETLQIFRC